MTAGAAQTGDRRDADFDLHGGRGSHGDQHGDADDRREAGRLQSVLLGVRRLPADPGRGDAPVWPPRRQLRPQTGLSRQRRPVPGGLAAVRLRLEHGVPDRVSRPAGHRRWRAGAAGVHHHRRCVGAGRAAADDGLCLRHLGHLRHHRPAAGRVLRPFARLAVRVLGQPADRAHRHGDGRPLSA